MPTETPSSAAGAATAAANKPKRLSCVNCRQRKIKCDRICPCTPCQRSRLDCVIPKPAPPRTRAGPKAKGAEIASRLSRLEGLVNAMGGEAALSGGERQALAAELQGVRLAQTAEAATRPVGTLAPPPPPPPLPPPANPVATSSTSSQRREPEPPVVGSDGTRFMGGEFWSNLSVEVSGLRELLQDANQDDEMEDEDESISSPSTPSQGFSQGESPVSGFLFAAGEQKVDLSSWYPAPQHVSLLMSVFFQRFDPIFKVLHKPSVYNLFPTNKNLSRRFASDRRHEALLFAIFYAAVTSLTPQECLERLNEDRQRLVSHYENAVMKALANADLLNTTELVTLQAFTIYLTCLRNRVRTRIPWTLGAVAIRIAYAIDLHCDGSGLGLPAFETEMRRRLWWQILGLDIQGQEDRGLPRLISPQSYDTQMPANINDEDIDPTSGFIRPEREGCTEMTFTRIECEVALVFEFISMSEPRNPRNKERFIVPTAEEKEKHITEVNRLLHERYIRYCNTSVPLEYAASLVAQICILKMWLLFQYPISSRARTTRPRPKATKANILSSAVSILEIQNRLEGSERFGWSSKNWVQWHPLAVTLAELCDRKEGGPIVDRAFAIVDTVFEEWSGRIADTKRGSLWQPIRKLLEKARAVHGRVPPPPRPPPFSRTPSSPLSSYLEAPVRSRPSLPGTSLSATASPSTFSQIPAKEISQLYETSIAMALDDPNLSLTGNNLQGQQPLLAPSSSSSMGLQEGSSRQVKVEPMGYGGDATATAAAAAAGMEDLFIDPVNWADWDTFLQDSSNFEGGQ